MKSELIFLFFIIAVCFISAGLVYSKSTELDVSVNVVDGKIADDSAEGNFLSNGDNIGYKEGSLNTLVRKEGIDASEQKGFFEFASLSVDNSFIFPVALIVLMVLIIGIYVIRKKKRNFRPQKFSQ